MCAGVLVAELSAWRDGKESYIRAELEVLKNGRGQRERFELGKEAFRRRMPGVLLVHGPVHTRTAFPSLGRPSHRSRNGYDQLPPIPLLSLC